MTASILSLQIRYERDVVLARQRGRQIAALLGFDGQDQTRIATALSEIARNAFTYAQGGKVEFRIEGVTAPQVLLIRVSDQGPGIPELSRILEGEYRSATGMGLGILGARRLLDGFEIRTAPGEGTTVLLKKLMPRGPALVDAAGIARISAELGRHPARDPIEEIQQQNQELLRALEELTRRQEELTRLNRELEDTNRGVVALYAELDERADHLRRADEVKSRFISNMSHEFRTPVNSIQALARLLLDRSDGDLTPEQERQIGYIRKSADALSELVNDLLDLAKVEAGKTVVRPAEFEVENLFGALRGMLRPLLLNESVSLVFEAAEDLPTLYTDEGKVSQVLRNFISNALKFTERGEVRVSARLGAPGTIVFAVADTGIGIDPADHERIFQEFSQIDSPIQLKVKGTGLGLPLCRRLVQLLGGCISVQSRPGLGATFAATIPIAFESRQPRQPGAWHVDDDRLPILVVENSPEAMLVYASDLRGSEFQVVAARTLREAREALLATRPRAIVLDILLQGEDSWSFLTEIKRDPETREIPVVVISTVDDARKGLALGADAYHVKPIGRDALLEVLRHWTRPVGAKKILVVDDEETWRYVLSQHLAAPQHVVVEASNGSEAIRLAGKELPHVICLDLGMPEMDGFETLRRLKAAPETRAIPVVVVTSRVLEPREHGLLLEDAAGILSKHDLSRERTLATVEEVMGPREAA